MIVVSTSGVERLQRTLTEFAGELHDMRDAAEAVAAHAQLLARSRAPRRTGLLQRSVRTFVGRNRSRIYVDTRRAPYGGVIEHGWRGHNIEPDHYMGQTYTLMQSWGPRIYEHELRQLIHRKGLA